LNVWQYAEVARSSHSMFPLGEWNQRAGAAGASAATARRAA